MQSTESITSLSAVEQRIRHRLSPWELFSIALCICLVFIFSSYDKQGHFAYDYYTYIQAGKGDLSHHYYAFWILPLYQLMATLPSEVGFTLWNLANIAGVFIAARIFGGRVPLVMLSYQMLFVLYYGQIIGILIGALALFYLALKRQQWYLAGFFILVACTKPQFGFTFGLFIFFLLDMDWHERFKVFVVPAAIAIASLIVYPFWPLNTIEIIKNQPPNDFGNISLWQWIGPLALVLWLFPLVLPLSFRLRLIALSATTALTIPYFQQTDLLTLFVLPVGWLPLLGYLGYGLYWEYGPTALKFLVIIPFMAYVTIILPSLYKWIGTGLVKSDKSS